MSGWFFGLFIWLSIAHRRIEIEPFLHLGAHGFFMLITGVVAVIVGLIFRAFDLLGERLRQREWAERELEMARAIQARLLPPPTLSGFGFSLTARNLPARMVAGDFYDFVRLDDGSIVIVVADVAGKGMGASLIMASVKAVLPFVAREGVAEAMLQLNRKLVGELGRREFVALVCARFAPAERTIELANAGCPDPYLVRNGVAEALSVDGMRLPLGLRADAHYATRRMQLEAGDRMLFLTDGIPEAPTEGEEQLGYEEVARIIGATTGDAWLDAFLANVRAHVREGLEDDWTAVALEVK
jgi:sigma-B regulation protein RsbU (phosphoserine phosphatase)